MRRTKTILMILIIASVLFTGCTANSETTTTTSTTTTTKATITTTTWETTTPTTQETRNQYKMGLVRSIPAEVGAGSTFTVTLTLTFNGTKTPGLFGITENYPYRWAATNISSGGLLRDKRSEIEWLFFPPFYGSKAQNSTLSYQMTVPSDAGGIYEFYGETITGSEEKIAITGQNTILIK